jgi:serine/threonine protein kinase
MASPSEIVRQHLRPGDLVANRYQIEQFIGAGAYGAIFSAIDTATMERVALKALPPANEGIKSTAVGRFQREMKVISRLRHPNIISIYDFGETDSRFAFMVVEFIDGVTLYDLVNRERLPESVALDLCEQVALALAEAHGKGVVHRDLKPQNVMVVRESNGRYLAKVLDFGMAKLTGGADESAQLTREGMAVGTPRYIAPEQARGKEVGPWSDIYALGLLFYEMFTSKRAVKADTIESAIMAHVSPEPLDLEEIDMVPHHVRPILFKMIEKKVSKRYQNAGELVRDLRKLRELDLMSTVPVGGNGIRTAEKSVVDPSRVPSIQSAANLELQQVQRTAPRRFVSQYDKEMVRRDHFYFRSPHNVFEWGEAGIAFFLMPAAFILLTAQFEGMDYALRMFVGMIPLFIALGVGFSSRTPNWNLSLFRQLFIWSAVTIILAHAMGMERLAIGLLRNPAWCVHPLADIPVLSIVHDLVVGFSRAYGGILSEAIGVRLVV